MKHVVVAILTQKGYEAVELWGLKQPRVEFFKDCVQATLLKHDVSATSPLSNANKRYYETI